MFFNDAASTEIYTLSLHDALPISGEERGRGEDDARLQLLDAQHVQPPRGLPLHPGLPGPLREPDRKSTRLNSCHANISYAVFCLTLKIIKIARTRDCNRGSQIWLV